MSNSAMNEDQEQKKKTSMEDSKAMTIEFLRARLLSERSISKTARQRADELSKRVSELEEELKFVSIMRKKAEKATIDVLAILENHGISDLSEGFDSNSDEGETPNEVNADTMMKETSTQLKGRKNELEIYYSSELESSPSTGRSLSWKSTKDSNFSLENKKCMELIKRRNSFAFNSSAARRAGKSCRKIKRRETRAVEEFQNDVLGKTKFPRDVTNCSDGEFGALRENNELDDPEKLALNPMLESNSESQKNDDIYIRGREREENMESALQHQAQLIGRFEAEEKAQREWEEKYTEKNSGTQDSCDPGNHSDLTDERDEVKFPEAIDDAGVTSLNDEERKGKSLDTRFSEELQPSKSLSLHEDEKKGFLQDRRCSDKIMCESSALELPFHVSERNKDQEFSKLHSRASADSVQQCMPVLFTPPPPSSRISCYAEKSTTSVISPSSSSAFELAVVPQETSNNLGQVLEALQQAKSSLKQTLNCVSPVTRESASTPDMFKVHTGSPALFRLPTDNQFKATTMANHPDIGTISTLSNFPHQITGGKFFDKPYIEPRIALSNDIFLTAPSSTGTEIRPGAVHQRSLSQPWLGTGPPSYNQPNHIDPFTNTVIPSFKASYPFPSTITLHSPLNEEALRTFSTSETGLPPDARLSSYGKPHINR